MSDTGPLEPQAHAAHPTSHSPAHYIKIWAILVCLLIVSVLGPLLGHPFVTLFTAFGIALIKAFLVITNFMHLNVEKRIAAYILGSMLAIMAIFVAGVAPDVMKHDGLRWSNVGAKEAVSRGLAEDGEAPLEHGKSGHGEHGK